MRIVELVYLGAGLALLGVVLVETDLGVVAHQVADIGWGAAVVPCIFHAVFLVDTFTWQLALARVPLDRVWLGRLFEVRLVGEAYNMVIPAGGMGGEPMKAMLLRRHFGIPFDEGIASVVLARTVNMLALIPFLVVGLALMLAVPDLPDALRAFAVLGLAGFVAATALLLVVQRLRLSSRAVAALARHRGGRRLARLLDAVRRLDGRFVAFYTTHRQRMLASLALSFGQWLLGVAEIWCILLFLGHPVSFAEAWIIEAVAQLVRAATFFIPANLGAMEGGLLLVCGALTGSPALGLAVALVRRARELVWIVLGFAVGWRRGRLDAAADGPPDPVAETAGGRGWGPVRAKP